jgi:hypothetical protein
VRRVERRRGLAQPRGEGIEFCGRGLEEIGHVVGVIGHLSAVGHGRDGRPVRFSFGAGGGFGDLAGIPRFPSLGKLEFFGGDLLAAGRRLDLGLRFGFGVDGRIETFALSRCLTIEGTGEHFARPAEFDARSFFKDAFGISQAEKPWKARVLFAKEVATYIRERVWHSSQQLRERRDGRLEMRLKTSGRKELTRWILSWMPNVKVLASRQLRERVKQRMTEGLANAG